MTIKCEKCGADVELAADAKTGKCEKCNAEVTVKEEAAAEEKAEAAAEEKADAAAEEKTEEAADAGKKVLTPAQKAKKIITLVVEIIIILVALAFVPRVCKRIHQFRMDAQGFSVNEGSKQLVECKSTAESVVIPGCFSSIGNHAFLENRTVKNVTLPTTIKSIGKEAFLDCTGLETVTFKGSAGMYALLDVATLAAFKKDETPAVIGEGAFERCMKLKAFEIPEGVTEIGKDAFSGCYALASVKIPGTVTKIGRLAFGRCLALKNVTIPDSVKTIEASAFSGSGVKEISIPKHFDDKVVKTWLLPEDCKVTKR